MSELMVLGFENEVEADRFGLKLAEMQKDMIVQLQDAAEVVRDLDGKPHVKHDSHLVGAGMGALFGKLGKTGIDSKVLQEMGDAVPPGKAGWFLLIGQLTEDKFLAAVKGVGATLVRSNLTEAQEKELKDAFGARKHEK